MSLFTLYAEFLDFLYLQDLVKKIWWVIRYRGQYSDDSEMQTLMVPMDDMNDRGIKEVQAGQYGRAPVFHVLFCGFRATLLSDRGTHWRFDGYPSHTLITIHGHLTNNTLAFERLLGDEKPSALNVYSCANAALAAGEYNSTSSLYPLAMDTRGESAMYSISNVFYNVYTVLPPVLQEDQMSFTFNSSEYKTTLGAPLRQVLEVLSTDYQDWLNATTSDYKSKAYPDLHRFNQLLDIQLQRDGPAIGVYG